VGTLGDKEDFSSLDLVREGMREGRAPLHVLIVFGGAEDASRWTSLSPGQDFSKRVVVVRIVVERDAELRGAAGAGGNGGEDGVVYVDKRGGFASACGVERGGALLVRPDGHIAWRSRYAPRESYFFSRPCHGWTHELESVRGSAPRGPCWFVVRQIVRATQSEATRLRGLVSFFLHKRDLHCRGFYVEGGEEAAALERWFGSGGF
jgi:hypothetical protein